ncbi:EAL domain-containing response regulator [Pseudomonas yamanorum]
MPIYPLRVLVLEDHPFQRSVAVAMLRRLGCTEVFEASDGVEALAVLNSVGAVDVALCDLQMEGMDGVAFFKKVADSGLVKALVVSSAVPADLRHMVKRLITLLGINLLGDVGKPLSLPILGKVLKQYSPKPCFRTATVTPIKSPGKKDMQRAIEANEFRAYFQPKFNLGTGQIEGVEVLARWLHPSMGVLPPSFFLPLLERYGLQDELFFDQLRQSLALQRYISDQGHSLNFAFNLHAAQLSNTDLTDRIKALLTVFGIPGSGLTFELTESGIIDTPITSLENLYRLRMMGCRLSIDDFGTGFSSLQRLCQLPFNEIKLDAEFVRCLDQETGQAVIISTLALGESLGMSVVVEGIETQEQRARLRELGCVTGQGYCFAMPMSGGDLLQRLAISPGICNLYREWCLKELTGFVEG